MKKGKNVGRRGIVASTLTRKQVEELVRIREAKRPFGRQDKEVPGLTEETRGSLYRDQASDLSFPVSAREREF